jgi:hypothetical protein
MLRFTVVVRGTPVTLQRPGGDNDDWVTAKSDRPPACYRQIASDEWPYFAQCHRPLGHDAECSITSPDCVLNRCDC